MRNKDVPTLTRLLEHARYEILPTPTIEDKLDGGAHRRPAHRHRVAREGPRRDPGDGRAAPGARVRRRAPPGRDGWWVAGSELEEIVARLGEAGVTTVFVPGGDAKEGDVATSTRSPCWRT